MLLRVHFTAAPAPDFNLTILAHLAKGLLIAMLAFALAGVASIVRTGGAPVRNLIVVDASIEHPAELLRGIASRPGTAIVTLTAGRDALGELAGIAGEYSNLDSIHLISHGKAGVLQIGGTDFDEQALVNSRAALATLGHSLAPGGDMLLYGCNIAETPSGRSLLQTMARLTGRDVAASENQTGSELRGGDWRLEYTTGRVETAALSAPQWNGLLSQNNTGAWVLGTNTASNTITVGANTTTATVSFSGFSTATTATTVANDNLNGIAVFTPALQSTPSLAVTYNWDTVPEAGTVLASTDGGTAVMTITFSRQVKDPILHFDRIGGQSNGQHNGATFTLQTAGVSLTRLSGTGHFDVTGSVVSNNLVGTNTGTGYTSESNTTPSRGTAAGSVRLNGTFTTVSFLMQAASNSLEGTGADAIEVKLTYDPTPLAQPDSFTSYGNATVTGTLTANNGSGTDFDFNTDALTITQINSAAYVVGTPIALANGQLTITSATTGAFSFIPTAGFTGVQTFTYALADANGGVSTATVTINIQRTTITVSKTSLGATGTFTFTGNNGWASQNITTVSSGVAAAGAAQTLTTPGTVTTITETIPPGYIVTAINCSGLGAGTATPNLATGSVQLNAAATALNNAVSCSFTNTKLPTLQLRKTSNGAVGVFSFAGNNGFGSDSITTVTQGTPANGTLKTLTAANTATTVTETIPPGYFIAAVSCSGLGSGTATPNLATGSLVLDANATAPGNTVVCTFTNTREAPGLTVAKSADTAGPVAAGTIITYTFTVTNTGNRPVSGVQIAESFTGTGVTPVPANETLLTDNAPLGDSTDTTPNNSTWSSLGVGDVIRFTATYTVTQSDIELLQ